MAEVAGSGPPRLDGPLPLNEGHDCTAFDCSRPSLDEWLKKHARRSDANDTARTFVIASDSEVVAYYALAGGGLVHGDAPGPLRRNAPDPVPVTILARLAVHRSMQGQGLAKALLADAMKRAAQAAATVASRALLVHALDEQAARFYVKHQFKKLKPSLPDDLSYFITMKDIREAL